MHLGVHVADGQVNFVVQDTGTGLDAGLASWLRGDDQTRPKGPGLGLSTVRNLVQKEGGRIEVGKGATENGTRFELWFPGRKKEVHE